MYNESTKSFGDNETLKSQRILTSSDTDVHFTITLKGLSGNSILNEITWTFDIDMTKTEMDFVQPMSLGILGKKGELILLNWKLQKHSSHSRLSINMVQQRTKTLKTFKKYAFACKTRESLYFDKINS